MPSMDVIVKINTQLWGVGRWARTLVIDTRQDSSVGCAFSAHCPASMVAALQIVH